MSEDEIKTEYEGWSIEYRENAQRWDAKKTFMIDGAEDMRVLNDFQLSDLKKKIKDFESRRLKSKGKRLKCINMSYTSFEEGEITSVHSESHWGGKRVWVTMKREDGKKRRETMGLKDLLKDTEKNRETLLKRKALLTEARALEDTLEKFKDEDVSILDEEIG